MNLRQGLLSLHRACQFLVAVAWVMAGGLRGMLGDDILLLGSWMEQKGVDGFSLSVFSFYIQQIRQAGCCGDDTEEVSGTPAPQIRSPANMDLWSPGGNFLLWKAYKGKKRGRERQREKEEEGEGRGGLVEKAKSIHYHLSLTALLTCYKTGYAYTRYTQTVHRNTLNKLLLGKRKEQVSFWLDPIEYIEYYAICVFGCGVWRGGNKPGMTMEMAELDIGLREGLVGVGGEGGGKGVGLKWKVTLWLSGEGGVCVCVRVCAHMHVHI